MLKIAKQVMLRTARRLGAFSVARDSRWRANQLLILCYHGVSLRDEHEWNPSLYVSRETLRKRLTFLRQNGFAILGLSEALARLRCADLPPRAVTITFDDGHYDFLEIATPVLREFDAPATVYLTTYHVDHNMPIFGLVTSYMLWLGRSKPFDLGPFTGGRRVSLLSPTGRAAALNEIVSYAQTNRLSANAKNGLAQGLAAALGIDWSGLIRDRFLHLLNDNEVRTLAAEGTDFQLHTHRHRSPRNEEAYRNEVRQNRERVRELTGIDAVHFCYPSGVHSREFFPWLSAEGIESATTCVPGLAAPATHPYLLPRLLDHEGLSLLEFESWATGIGAMVPSRSATLIAARPGID